MRPNALEAHRRRGHVVVIGETEGPVRAPVLAGTPPMRVGFPERSTV
jgi:hypothetical protein